MHRILLALCLVTIGCSDSVEPPPPPPAIASSYLLTHLDGAQATNARIIVDADTVRITSGVISFAYVDKEPVKYEVNVYGTLGGRPFLFFNAGDLTRTTEDSLRLHVYPKDSWADSLHHGFEGALLDRGKTLTTRMRFGMSPQEHDLVFTAHSARE